MPIGVASFEQIISGGFTLIDKTLLISEFIKNNNTVLIISHPEKFSKTTNITMLKCFFSVPNLPDNLGYQRALFKETKVMENSEIIQNHFCKHPVIHITFKNYNSCNSWKCIEARLHEELSRLYREHQAFEI
ncbi:26922_t:CDS:2 [Dentiscutata erythropus]|uniref:26922_t:CDS:1 n=1 Tax=Dentiscutata erythropus TaxID=1348616 RepID=A0A9N9HPK3_9GLOM|nr:26922_t:CDS:2 [Dentiscutata erythropus]